MVRVTWDKDKLGNADFITFYVSRASEDKTTVSGYHVSPKQEEEMENGIKRTWLYPPLCLPVEQAFEEARRFAKSEDISDILIIDPDQQFDVEPWLQQGVIDYLDDCN